MKSLILLSLIGLAYCAPQWPYRDSMQPYYYGYPGQTPYVYRPQIEDDEGDDIPMGRQDLPVVSGGQDNLGNQQIQQQLNPVPLNVENSPVVVETGSAAPVSPQQQSQKQQNKNQQPLNAQTPPNVNNPNGQREPPPFPPATTARPKPDEDDSEEEDEDEDEDADADADAEDEEQQSEESEEEEDRRRQEPINNKSESGSEEEPVVTTQAPPPPPPPAPVVVNDTVSSSVEDVEEVVKDIVTPDSKKHPVRIEALVPGYVTDQGEVLVPVDTVTGDQPISIVPDPYTPPARGIPATEFEDSPYFYAETLRRNHPIRRTHYRQEEAEDSEEEEADTDADAESDTEDVEDEGDSEEEEAEDEKGEGEKIVPLAAIPARAPSNEDDERDSNIVHGPPAKARHEESQNSFPPSRSPQLFAVINSKIPVNQQFLNRYYGQQQVAQRRNPYFGYLAGQQQQGYGQLYGPGQYGQSYAPGYGQGQQVFSRIIYKNQNQSPNYLASPNYFSSPAFTGGQYPGYPKRRKNPIASVEFSLESDEEDYYNSPYNFNRPSFSPNFNRFRPQPGPQKIIYRRRPGTAPQVKRPTFINKQKPVRTVKPVKQSTKNNVNKKKVVNNNQPNIGLLAVYNLGEGSQNQKFNRIPALPLQYIRRRPTPVIKQDDIVDDISAVSSSQQDFEQNDYNYYESPEVLRLSRRDAKQIKRKKEGSGKKVNSSDPLGLLGKIHNRKY